MKLRKHSAAAAVAVTWIGGINVLLLHPPDIHEAISQYSVYGETWVLFGITLTLAAICLFLFATTLGEYWPPANRLTKIAAIGFMITAWTPYGTDTLPHWLHVIAFLIAVFSFTLALWRTTISFYPRLSHALLIAVAGSGLAAGVAVISKRWSFHLELTMLIIAHLWCLLLAYAPLLEQRRAAIDPKQV